MVEIITGPNKVKINKKTSIFLGKYKLKSAKADLGRYNLRDDKSKYRKELKWKLREDWQAMQRVVTRA